MHRKLKISLMCSVLFMHFIHTICSLSNHLQLFSKFCALPWKEVQTVAADILDTVKNQDEDYFNHLKSALGEKILPIDVYDFAYEILHKVQVAPLKRFFLYIYKCMRTIQVLCAENIRENNLDKKNLSCQNLNKHKKMSEKSYLKKYTSI